MKLDKILVIYARATIAHTAMTHETEIPISCSYNSNATLEVSASKNLAV